MESILLIEDNEDIAQLLKLELEAEIIISKLEHALGMMSSTSFSAIIANLNILDSDGQNIIIAIRKYALHIPIIAITGYIGSCVFAKTIQLSIHIDEFKFSNLEKSIRYVIDRYNTRKIFMPIQRTLDSAIGRLQTLLVPV